MIIDIFELSFLPFIIFIGLVTSYEDIKYKKIRNIWILMSIFYSIIVLFLMIILTQVLNKSYIITFVWNMLIVTALSFILWNSGLWSAGDGKLFIAYSMLIPLTVYEIGSIAYFPSYIILVNTFLPLFFLYLIRGLIKSNFKQNISIIRTINIKYILNSSLIILSLHSIIYALFYTLNWKNFYLIVISSIIILILLQNIKHRLIIYSLFLLALLSLILNFEKLISFNFLESISMVVFIVVFIRFLAMGVAFIAFTEDVKINKLKRGMYLAEKPPFKLLMNSQNKFRAKISFKKYTPFLFKSFELKEENIKKLKKFYRNGKLSRDYVKIYQKAPFAPAIFLGVLVTIILRGNMVVFIKIIIENFI